MLPGKIGVAEIDYTPEEHTREFPGEQRHHRSSMMREDHEYMTSAGLYENDGELPSVDTFGVRPGV